jgi:multidrug efflux pump subunit AcrA (membrane-fusion protein)
MFAVAPCARLDVLLQVHRYAMNTTEQSVSRLAIPVEKKTRRKIGPLFLLFLALALLTGAGIAFFNTHKDERATVPAVTSTATVTPQQPADSVLTVSGYIIPRERIELSPRFMATVKWIGVKKGDTIQLEDEEYKARVWEVEGRVALADLNDLQVEIDINEADLSKVHLKQRCRVSPKAYPDKKYNSHVAEIAPEANRSKGTLQLKVQIEKPDTHLTPELIAKVEFLPDKS